MSSVFVRMRAWVSVALMALVAGVVGAADVAAHTTGEVKVANVFSAAAVPREVVARIDLSDQRMKVYVNGRLAHNFVVSTGRGSYRTPTGQWSAKWLSPRHRSRKYNNAPMPWSVFFHRGYAVHGTTDVKRLGQPASHGCIRLHPNNAEVFFKLVKNAGLKNTLINVVN